MAVESTTTTTILQRAEANTKADAKSTPKLTMLNGIFFKTLRDQRGAILGWGAGLGAVLLFTAEQYPQMVGAGSITIDHAQQVIDVTKLSRAFQVMSGEVVLADSVGSYVTGRTLGVVACILSLWAIAAVVTALRGDEDSGALDLLTAEPVSRTSILLQKLAAIWAALMPIGIIAWLGLWAGYVLADTPMPIVPSLLAIANCLAVPAFWASIGAIAAQLLAPRRMASWTTIWIAFGAFIVNNIIEGSNGLRDLAGLFPSLPWHLYSLSKPLATDRDMEWGAFGLLLLLAIAGAGIAARLFQRRDLGSALRYKGSRKSTNGNRLALWSPKSVWWRNLREHLVPAALWGLGLGALGIVFASSVNDGLEPLRKMTEQAPGWLTQVFGVMLSPEAYMQIGLLMYGQIIPVMFAINQVSAWASDEEEGRLEVQMTMPIPRYKELLARYFALSVSIGVLVTLGWLGTTLGLSFYGVQLDLGLLARCMYAAGLLGLSFAALGLAVATLLKRPSPAIATIIALVAVMYFFNFFAPLWDIPAWIKNLSFFHLYGHPMTEGLNIANIVALAGITLAGWAVGVVALQRRDIAR